MKILITILAILPVSSIAQNGDGPFGFDIGSDLSDHKSCKQTETLGMYQCDNAKKPHPDMETYLVQYFDGVGICWVKGVSKNVSDSGFGTSTKALTDKLKNQIANVYGEPTKTYDFLSYGSIWDDLDDWMMGVNQKERHYTYTWMSEDGYNRIKRVDQIYLSAKALSKSTGYVIVEFNGDNGALCDSKVNEEGASAF